MAFLSSGNGMRPNSSGGAAGTVPNGILDQQSSSQDLRSLTLQQQLLAAMQAQQASAAGSTGAQSAAGSQPQPGVSSNASSNAALSLYQQLLSQQQQQQAASQQQQQQTGIMAQAPASNVASALPPQFAAALQQQVQNPLSNSLQQQLAGGLQANSSQGTSGALSALLASNPTLLQSLLMQQSNGAGSAAPANPLSALAAQLLMPQQAAIQQQQQQLLSLLQLLGSGLQNPAATTLLAYQNYLQQMQPAAAPTQQPPPAAASAQNATASQSYLQQLAQLVGANNYSPQLTQLAAALGQQPSLGSTAGSMSQTDEHKAFVEELLRRDQQQHSANAAAATANGTHHTSRLTSQGSSNSLLGAPSNSFPVANDSLPSSRDLSLSKPPEPAVATTSASAANSSISASGPSTSFALASRQPSSDRLLTSAESVQDHISRLISENEAIVEPNPVLLKRRPYHRQSTSNSLASQSSDAAGTSSQRGSPGLRSPGLASSRAPTTRSQSLHESSMLSALRMGGGSLTSGQPIIRNPYQSSSLTCNFCMLKFPNEAGLEAHEFRCSKKEQLQKQHSQPQLQIPSSLTSAPSQSQAQQLLQLQQQQKLLAQHQSNIAALVGAGAGVAPDAIINGAGNSGRSSVPADSHSALHNDLHLSPPPQLAKTAAPVSTGSPAPQNTVDNRHPLKKRLLAAAAQEAENASNMEPVSDPKVPKVEIRNDLIPGTSTFRVPQPVAEHVPRPTLDLKSQDLLGHPWAQPPHQQLASSSVAAALQEQQRQEAEVIANLALLKQLATTPQQQELLAAALEKTRREVNQASLQAAASAAANSAAVGNTATTSSTSSQNLTSPSSACPKGMKEAIIVAVSYCANKIGSQMPYFLTLSEQIAEQLPNDDAPIGATSYRNRMRNITSDTFVCLNRPQPMFVEHTGSISMYSNWKQAPVPLNEEAMLRAYLGACSTKPRIGVKEYGRYTVATHRDGTQLRSTHSSFWVNRKHRLRNATVVEASGYVDSAVAHSPMETSAAVDELQNERVAEVKPAYLADDISARASHLSGVETPTRSNSAADESKPQPDVLRHSTSPTKSIEPEKPKIDVNSVIGVKVRNPSTKVTGIGKIKPMGERTEEVEVYVRGRGRGRYVCERCGIRCKKPSMLKKHLKSHTNIRPFTCITCNFSFKTKGNLTKHLFSKAHRRRLAEKKGAAVDADELRSQSAMSEDSEEGRLMVDIEEEQDERGRASTLRTPIDADDPTIMKMSILECKFVNDEFENQNDDDYGSDNDDEDHSSEPPPPCSTSISYRRFGQENILVERSTHTPPTLWTLCHEDISTLWPKPDMDRNCNSAPPVAQCSPVPSRKDRKTSTKSTDEAAVTHSALPNLQLPPAESLPSLTGDAFADNFRVQHQFLASDISPPSSADFSSAANGLLANFIPLSKPKYGGVSTGDQSTSITLTASGVVPVGGIFDTDSLREVGSSAFGSLTQPFPSSSADTSQSAQDLFLEPLQRSRARTNPAHAMFDHKAIESNHPAKFEGTSVEAFLANEAQEFFCDMCERKFRKESELLLHKQTHLIERQQNARSRTYQCPECRTTLRSKALLAKHIETVHNSAGSSATDKEPLEDKAAVLSSPNVGSPTFSNTPVGSQQSVTVASPLSASALATGGRSFVCTDCNLGFRTHGVLAKHLRSKNHVKMLANTGKLPDDALTLIKENSAVLASVDATDCESARQSLWNLLSDLRQGANPGKSPSVDASPSPSASGGHVSSLECREQLGAQSPGPQTPSSLHKIGFPGLHQQSPQARPPPHGMTSTYQKNTTPLPHGLKRKNSERPSPGEFSPAVRRRCDSAVTTRPMSATTVSIPQQFSIGSPQQRNLSTPSPFSAATRGRVASDSIKDVGHIQIVHNGEHPLHSLATVAAAAANVNGSHTKSIVANVWIPPRLEQIETERTSATPDAGPNGISSVTRLLLDAAAASDGGLSSRSAEETSESTGRSESSTPVQRGLNGVVQSPMPASTRCPFCDITYDSAIELQIHFHTEHIVMRDGKDYRCPRKHCEKVYPNRESLRAHFAAHFLGGGATPTMDGREEPGVAVSPSERESSPSLRKTTQQIQAATAPSAPNHSPGAPEETHTVTEGSSSLKSGALPLCSESTQSVASPKQELCQSPQAETKAQQWTPPPLTLRCDFCGDTFNDPSQLQKHWISHMGAQLRPFVCRECDAGFTTADALASHSASHQK